jgi:hypothetical protein
VVQETIIQLARGPMKRGVKKMYATLLFPEYDNLGAINATDVAKVFQEYNLWAGKRKSKVKLLNRCRDIAGYTNLIWHTDPHHFNHGGWIIA